VGTDPLAVFDEAVTSFRESSHLMHGPVGALNLADHTHRAEAGITAHDVYAFCHTFRRLYVAAFADLQEDLAASAIEFASRPGENATPEEWSCYMDEHSERTRDASMERFRLRLEGADNTTAFTLAFKALYLFLRSHQDALCALVHTVLFPRGTGPGPYNMTRHLQRENGPVRAFIVEHVPEYEEWYLRWRDTRNRVKRGNNFGTYGSGLEMGVSFSEIIPEGGGVSVDVSQGVGLADIVEALRMSERLQNAIARQAERAGASGPNATI
jgi:hypothetical protein